MSGYRKGGRRSGFRIALAMAFAVLTSAAAAQQRGSDPPWNDCIFSDNLDLRIEACTQVLARGKAEVPRNRAVILHNRGFVYGLKKDYERAIADLSEAIRLDPKDALAYYSRGSVHSKKGDFNRAIKDLSEAIRFDPKYAIAYYSRGSAYDNLGKADQALADYSESIRLDASYAIAWYSRGNIHYDKNRYDEAIVDYSEAIRLDPDDSIAWHSRGFAWYAKNDFDRAIADYTESIRLDPQNAYGYNNRGYAYMDKGEFDRAIDDFSVVTRIDANDVIAFFNRGIAWYNKGDYPRAIADFSEAVRLDPADPDPYINRGEAYAVLGDHTRAVADYEEALKIDPKREAALRLRWKSKSLLGEAPPEPQTAGIAVDVTGKEPEIAGDVRKHALVVGINTYRNVTPLTAAVNDARVIAAGLKTMGFSVIVGENVDYAGMSAQLVELEQNIQPGDTVFFFFSGHGMAIKGRNYLLPADIPTVPEGQEALFEYASFTADKVLERVKGRGARAVVLVLDACRDNPFPRQIASKSVGSPGGLNRMSPPEGVFVLFAAATDQVALDRLGPKDTNPNSVFTRVFAEEFVKPGVPLVEIAKTTQERVRDLARKAGRDQRPAYYDEIVGRFALR